MFDNENIDVLRVVCVYVCVCACVCVCVRVCVCGRTTYQYLM